VPWPAGFLLYGLSMLYGATGTLDIGQVFKAVNSGQIKPPGAGVRPGVRGGWLASSWAWCLSTCGFPMSTKVRPRPVTLMIGGAPKLAAFAITMRLLVDGLLPLAIDWQQMLAVLAIGSLLVGNLAAIAQTNLKRMLATPPFLRWVLCCWACCRVWSTAMWMPLPRERLQLRHVLRGDLCADHLAAFGVILLLAREGFESEEIADLAGLNQRSPLYAGVMAVCLFSMAGIPPLVGFYAKLSVLQALVASGQGLYIALAVFAVVMSLIGAFYYLRVVKVMYFDAPLTATSVSAPLDVRVVLTVNGALVLVLGLLPGGLMALCADAIVRALAT
jgi:NADH-quinone oxidoreductase subunit N